MILNFFFNFLFPSLNTWFVYRKFVHQPRFRTAKTPISAELCSNALISESRATLAPSFINFAVKNSHYARWLVFVDFQDFGEIKIFIKM